MGIQQMIGMGSRPLQAYMPDTIYALDIKTTPDVSYASIVFFGAGSPNTPGDAVAQGSDTATGYWTWLLSGDPEQFDVMYETTGGALTSGTADTWINLTGDVEFSIAQPDFGSLNSTGTIHLRPAGGGPDIATAYAVLQAIGEA